MAEDKKDEKTTATGSIESDSKTGSFTWHAPSKPKTDTDVKISQPTNPLKPAVQDTTPDKFKGCQSVKVQDGESLLEIANKFNVALEQLRYFNGIDKATLKISKGQTIYIPKGAINVPVGK